MVKLIATILFLIIFIYNKQVMPVVFSMAVLVDTIIDIKINNIQKMIDIEKEKLNKLSK